MHRSIVLFAIVGVTVRADATEPTQSTAPCRGCTLDVAPDVAAGAKAAPLVVVLHGNTDDARERAAKWREPVLRRGWSLLSLDCPASLGCEDRKWYSWQHDPGWVREQVRDVAEHVRVDPSRIYLVGWSGGATFVGKHLHAWPQTFAAVVIHGGGVPPRDRACLDRALPAYFLVGDKNPGHGGAKRLRAYLARCGQDVRWDLLPGANHAREDDALTPKKADEILRWLDARRRDDNVG